MARFISLRIGVSVTIYEYDSDLGDHCPHREIEYRSTYVNADQIERVFLRDDGQVFLKFVGNEDVFYVDCPFEQLLDILNGK